MNTKTILWLTIIGSIGIAKRKKTGSLIATLFFLSVAFTLLLTFCLPNVFSLVFAIISLILFIALIYTFFNREKYY